ncbi:endonuclease III domain-containing protein, partial [Porphyromonas uenonis]
IGLASSRATTPLAVEQALRRRIPREQLIRAHHQLILLGRYICKARKPLCDECTLTACCRHYATAKS